jgi:hypothetical protein
VVHSIGTDRYISRRRPRQPAGATLQLATCLHPSSNTIIVHNLYLSTQRFSCKRIRIIYRLFSELCASWPGPER